MPDLGPRWDLDQLGEVKYGPSPTSAWGFRFFSNSICLETGFLSLYEGIYLVYFKNKYVWPRRTPSESWENSTSGQFYFFAQFFDIFADSWYFNLILKPSICLRRLSHNQRKRKQDLFYLYSWSFRHWWNEMQRIAVIKQNPGEDAFTT